MYLGSTTWPLESRTRSRSIGGGDSGLRSCCSAQIHRRNIVTDLVPESASSRPLWLLDDLQVIRPDRQQFVKACQTNTYHPPPPGEGVEPFSLSSSSHSLSSSFLPGLGVFSDDEERALLARGVLPEEAGPREMDRLRFIDDSDEGPGSPGVIAADTDLDDRPCGLDDDIVRYCTVEAGSFDV